MAASSAARRAISAALRLSSLFRSARPRVRRVDGERTERVGLHHVGPGGEVFPVHLLDELRAGVDEDLVAPFQLGPAEVVGGEVLLLEPGAGGAVEHDDLPGDQIEVRGGRRR